MFLYLAIQFSWVYLLLPFPHQALVGLVDLLGASSAANCFCRVQILFYPHNVSGLKITAVPIHSILKLKTTQVV